MSSADPSRPEPAVTKATRRWGARLSGWLGPFELSVESLVCAVALYWAVVANRAFLAGALEGRGVADPSAWGLGLALGLMVAALHVLLIAPLSNRWSVKPLLSALLVCTALAVHFIESYGVYLDPSMLRNALRSHPAEARELLHAGLLADLLLYAGLPLLLLWRVKVVRRPWLKAALVRVALLVGAAGVLVLSVWSVFQPLSSMMRNQKDLRYLITPANAFWSLGVALQTEARGAAEPRQAIGLDARPGASWAGRERPLVIVLVVGETVRAANWGLGGYARPTTPELATLPVVNFPDVTACGTNTEVSLPCMFAPVGRRDYDETRIRRQESLLHVAARAGAKVQWWDNQSGCKGVCDGLAMHRIETAAAPGLCTGTGCLDGALFEGLEPRLRGASGTELWVLHMLGNHGPSYFRRYPPEFARFQPECRSDDLRTCSREEVVNAYDNAVLYTDHLLASAVRTLQAHASRVDSALVFVSDHGESLGENGLFLHGMPYAIAPQVQKRVPMVTWASPGLERAIGLPAGCLETELRRRAREPVAHDHLFHTLLGLLDIRTSLHEPELDLVDGCRRAPTPQGRM